MPDEPSGYEMQRSIEAIRTDIREGNAAMRADFAGRLDSLDKRLDTFVSAQVHASDLLRVDQRIDGVEADVAELKAAKRAAIGIAVMAAGVVVAIVAVIGDFL